MSVYCCCYVYTSVLVEGGVCDSGERSCISMPFPRPVHEDKLAQAQSCAGYDGIVLCGSLTQNEQLVVNAEIFTKFDEKVCWISITDSACDCCDNFCVYVL